jgi:Spx/MgsR family transcriptional regulator
MILYGIPTCDSCKAALKALKARGHDVTFRDIRAEPLSRQEIEELVAAFGDGIVNRASTTWRGLSDWLRESDAAAQLAAHPTLMKRPVIRQDDGRLHVGWDTGVQALLLA